MFAGKLTRSASEQFTPFMRMVLLQSIDSHWREHLAALDYLRQGIHLRGYAQKNPKQEYKREAFELFAQLLDVVKMEVTRLLMTVRIQSQEQVSAGGRGDRGACQPGRQRHLHASQRRRQRVAKRPSRAQRRSPARAQGRPQRPLPVRQRQEVQALPRQAGLMAYPRCADWPLPLRGRRQWPGEAGSMASAWVCIASSTRGAPDARQSDRPDPGDLHAVPGVRIGVAMAGMRKANRKDLVVIALDEGARWRACSRSNRFCAAPVQLCREHLAAGGGIRALLINTGNANAGTGADGLARARRSCAALASLIGRAAAAGAAVFDRRDHGNAADRAHRSRLAGRAGAI